MIELPLVFVAGALGSSHCIGMCGPFALTIGSGAPRLGANLRRQILFTAGRIFTYAFMGAVAGAAGTRLASGAPAFVNMPAMLAVVAGSFLIFQGLKTAGVFRRRPITGVGGPCLAGSFLASYLKAPGWHNVFLAGMLAGLMPCGLVYALLALASGSGHMALGMVVMAVFGLGTAPVMIATGAGGSLLKLAARRRLLQAAAWCVVLTGIVSIARGASYFSLAGREEPPACPFCADAELPAWALDREGGRGNAEPHHVQQQDQGSHSHNRP